MLTPSLSRQVSGGWGQGPCPQRSHQGLLFFLNPTSWQNPNSSPCSLSKDQGEKYTKKSEKRNHKQDKGDEG